MKMMSIIKKYNLIIVLIIAIAVFFGLLVFDIDTVQSETECSSPPQNMQPSGIIRGYSSSGEIRINLSWSPVPGAVSYNVRLNDGTTDHYDDPRYSSCSNSSHYYCENGITTTSVTSIPVTYGRIYRFWVEPIFSPSRSYCYGETKFKVGSPKISIANMPLPAGNYIDSGFDSLGTTSFSSYGKILIAYFFYWYNNIDPKSHITDSDGSDALTDHPSTYPNYTNPAFSYKSVDWWKKELRDMNDAGIDIVVPAYWGYPGVPQADWSVEGLKNLVVAIESLKADHLEFPKIGMFYDTTTLKNIFLVDKDEKAYMWAAIRDFWSLIPPKYWAQIDGRPVTVLFWSHDVASYNQEAFDYLREQFRQHFGGKEIYLVLEESWKNITAEKDYAWGAAPYTLWGGKVQPTEYFINKGVAEIGPGYNDSAVLGRNNPIRDRNYGISYKTDWQKAINLNKNIIAIETWNEFHEGSDIADSYEYGRKYIWFTNALNNRWRGKANNAEFVLQSTPSTINVNSTIPVSITMRNNGLTTWVRGAGFRLGSQNPQDNLIWNLSRVGLNDTDLILPTQTKTFTFNVKAPANSGTYSFQWRMLQEAVEWFGDFTPKVVINVVSDIPPPTKPTVQDEGNFTTKTDQLYASWSSSDPKSGIAEYQYQITQDSTTGLIIRYWTSTEITPYVTAGGLTLTNGKTYYFSVKAKNGAGLWSSVGYSDGIKVDTTASVKPTITSTSGSSNTTLAASWSSSDPESGITEYQYKITESSTSGTVIRDWTSTGTTPSVTAIGLGLKKGKYYYFSVKAKNGAGLWSAVGYSGGIYVNYTSNAQFVSQSVPTVMNKGTYYTVSIIMKNTGTSTWINPGGFRLGPQNPQDNLIWGIGRVGLSNPDSIAPGQSKTFTFTVKAPANSGTYSFQWRMLQEFVEWFGNYTVNAQISVQ